MVITKSAKNLKAVLMDPHVKPIDNPYYLISEDSNLIYVLTPGLNGVEFNKTIGFIGNYPGITIYHCLWGQGLLILQRNDEEGEAKEFKVMSLSPGKQAGVPAGWASVLVNVGKNFLVVLESGSAEEKQDNIEPLIEKRGLAYYVVEKKGEISFEQNSAYKVHPQITTE